MLWRRQKEGPDEKEEELRLLREATDDVRKAARELQSTNEALRRRLAMLEESYHSV